MAAYVIIFESGARVSDTIRFASAFFPFPYNPTLFTALCGA